LRKSPQCLEKYTTCPEHLITKFRHVILNSFQRRLFDCPLRLVCRVKTLAYGVEVHRIMVGANPKNYVEACLLKKPEILPLLCD